MSKQLQLEYEGGITVYSTSRSDVVVPSPSISEYLNVSDDSTLDNVIKNITQKGTITIPNDNDWTEERDKPDEPTDIWSHTVNVSGATINSHSKIDIQPSPKVIKQLIDANISSLQLVNNNGTVTLYAIGDSPENLDAPIQNVQVTVSTVFD